MNWCFSCISSSTTVRNIVNSLKNSISIFKCYSICSYNSAISSIYNPICYNVCKCGRVICRSILLNIPSNCSKCILSGLFSRRNTWRITLHYTINACNSTNSRASIPCSKCKSTSYIIRGYF